MKILSKIVLRCVEGKIAKEWIFVAQCPM